MKLISIVVPTYNEEEGISHFLDVLSETLSKIKNYEFEIVLVNDGSKDNTYQIELEEAKKRDNLVVVNLSRNFGHESAIAAGLTVAKGDAVIPMDSDLQDPPELIPELLKKYEEGYDVVNAKRLSREGETAFKKKSAKFFYRLIAKLSGKVKIPENVGHYRLISRRVVDEVNKLKDSVRVLRVEIPYLGYKTTEIGFVRNPRELGKTHYDLEAMNDLALDSIIITTGKPLKIIRRTMFTFLSFFMISSLCEIIFFIIYKCGIHLPVLDKPFFLAWLIINVVLFVTVAIFGALAMISEYTIRLYKEAQDRPFFVIESIESKGNK